MDPFSLSQNYYLRKCYLEREQVPTQSVMKEKMHPPLAAVCFKSLSPKLKVLAGLEPPLKGGGESWFNPPQDLLKSRAVLKPFPKKYMSQWNCYGVDEIGMKLVLDHQARLRAEKDKIVDENNKHWEQVMTKVTEQTFVNKCVPESAATTKYINEAFTQFRTVYIVALSKLEKLLLESAMENIQRFQEATYQKMQARYERLLRQQATMMNIRYRKKLTKTKARFRKRFARRMKFKRSRFTKRLNNVILEKHTAIEKTRKYLECQKLACQVYVALKEKEKCTQEMKNTEIENSKEISTLKHSIQFTEFCIKHAAEKDKKQKELDKTWRKKVCDVVKSFQMLVSYCLDMVPEQADFFINMEKLMLLQLSESLDNQSDDSIITKEDLEPNVVAKPRPFYLCCDKGAHKSVHSELCPKHVTSSASQMPVIVVNKRCIYAACDNFEQFGDKIKDYVEGELGDETDIKDDHDYTINQNVTYSASQQLRELKLESSLMQVLQQEIVNIRNAPINCSQCNIPYCFDCINPDLKHSVPTMYLVIKDAQQPTSSNGTVLAKNKISKEIQSLHAREPQMEAYLKYVRPKRCDCAKMAKKHLDENLPPYMKQISPYVAPEVPNYETCTIRELEELVKKARNEKVVPPPPREEPKTKEQFTQISDQNFDYLCTCFSAQKIKECYLKEINLGTPVSIDHFELVGGSMSPSFLARDCKTFANERALSLIKLIKSTPDIKDLFESKDCKIYDHLSDT